MSNVTNLIVDDVAVGGEQPVWADITGTLERTMYEIAVLKRDGILVFHRLACNLAQDDIISA